MFPELYNTESLLNLLRYSMDFPTEPLKATLINRVAWLPNVRDNYIQIGADQGEKQGIRGFSNQIWDSRRSV